MDPEATIKSTQSNFSLQRKDLEESSTLTDSFVGSLKDSDDEKDDPAFLQRRPTTKHRLSMKRQSILKYIPFLKYPNSQELYASDSSSKTEFKLTTCGGCLIMVIAFMFLGFAILTKFQDIGVSIQQQYAVSSIGFSDPVIITPRSFSWVYLSAMVPSFEYRDKAFFKDITDDKGQPVDISTSEAYYRTICNLVQVEIDLDLKDEWCAVPLSCHVASVSYMNEGVWLIFSRNVEDIQDFFKNITQQVEFDFSRPALLPGAEWCDEQTRIEITEPMFNRIRLRFEVTQGAEKQLDVPSLYLMDKAISIMPQLIFQMMNITENADDDLVDVQVQYQVDHVSRQGFLPKAKSFSDWIFNLLSILNIFNQDIQEQDWLSFKKIVNASSNAEMEATIPYYPEASIHMIVTYPPKSVIVKDYYSTQDFLAEIGGYLSIVKVFIGFSAGFVIFKELNRHMAKRILSQEEPNFSGSKKEREARLKEIEKDFRNSVSLEGIYNLHKELAQEREQRLALSEIVKDQQTQMEAMRKELDDLKQAD